MASTMVTKSKLKGLDAREYATHRVETTPPTTPTALSTSTNDLLSEIRRIYNELTGLSNLAPGNKINNLLTHLVGICIKPYSPELTEYFFRKDGVDELCDALRSLCAIAEGELENYWVQRILYSSAASNATSQTKTLLNAFPYYENYLNLSRLETALLSPFLPYYTSTTTNSSHNVAFIGSGPLPLSSFCLLDTFPNAIVHNVDRDATAILSSQELTKKLGYEARMTFACEDVSIDAKEGSTKWQQFNVVFLAALVGMDSGSKWAILNSLAKKLRPGTIVVARSARGLRRVLYPVLDLSDALGNIGFEVVVEVHPWTDVVNSVIILRLKERL